MVDNTLPGEVRLSMYLASRYLQELELALRLVGVAAQYKRPGIDGVGLPRLHVVHPGVDKAICAVPRMPCRTSRERDAADPQWWFIWWSPGPLRSICPAVDMNRAARIIAEQVNEDT